MDIVNNDNRYRYANGNIGERIKRLEKKIEKYFFEDIARRHEKGIIRPIDYDFKREENINNFKEMGACRE